MGRYKIKVTRIETVPNAQVRITFQIDHGPVAFQVPIMLAVGDFDDTEMVQAARSTMHRMFVELAAQSKHWKLSAKSLRQLSKMSMRPKGRGASK
jgi:hypothetical protein